jgi:hypothetical protein
MLSEGRSQYARKLESVVDQQDAEMYLYDLSE